MKSPFFPWVSPCFPQFPMAFPHGFRRLFQARCTTRGQGGAARRLHGGRRAVPRRKF